MRQIAGHAAAGDGISADAWSGYRNLSDAEIDALAMVDQVRMRGPFVSLADFVNRRLANDATGIQGALEAAIEAAGINGGVIATPCADRPAETGGVVVDANHRELAQVAGAPGWLKQADLLQALAPGLAGRSDTFVVRTYGKVRNPVTNSVEGRAWLEALVQRRPDYVDDANAPEDRATALSATHTDFGRKFEVVSFRWLNPDDIFERHEISYHSIAFSGAWCVRARRVCGVRRAHPRTGRLWLARRRRADRRRLGGRRHGEGGRVADGSRRRHRLRLARRITPKDALGSGE